MEAARTSETFVNFYQTPRRYNPEDSHLRAHRRENLKSYNSCEVVPVLNHRKETLGSGGKAPRISLLNVLHRSDCSASHYTALNRGKSPLVPTI
jgi:hypothetical protein